jgi:hypothetical protein
MIAKVTEGKLPYEIDWLFVKDMAERMFNNKGKYEPYSWQKTEINLQELKNGITRHFIEIQNNNFQDGDEPFGHILALACNMMILNYQLKHFHDRRTPEQVG